jgi:hypothetical protein
MTRWQLQHGSEAHPFEQQTLRLLAVQLVLILTFLDVCGGSQVNAPPPSTGLQNLQCQFDCRYNFKQFNSLS